MSDATGAQGATNGEGGGQRFGGSPVVVNAQYIRDLSFENPNAPQTLTGQSQPPKIDMGVDVQARTLNETMSEVVLHMRAEARQGDKTMFIVELSYAGVFTLPQELTEDQKKAVLLIEAPRLLFPFARAIMAEATINGGYPPLMLQPLDFVDLYRRQIMANGEQAATKA